MKYRKSYLKLYVINKEPHPENLKQSHKIDYPAYQSNRRLVNTFKGMKNSGVISHYLKEIVHEEAMQIIEWQRQQKIEEEKDQHKIPQDQNLQDQQQRTSLNNTALNNKTSLNNKSNKNALNSNRECILGDIVKTAFKNRVSIWQPILANYTLLSYLDAALIKSSK